MDMCRRRRGITRTVWIALVFLVSTATALPTRGAFSEPDASNLRATAPAHHSRALTQTCPTDSAYDASLGDCVVTCLGGYFWNESRTTTIDSITVLGVCEPCAPGSYRAAGEANECVQCEVGSSNSRSGQATCVPCSYQDGSKYANTTGAVQCNQCPAGTTQRVGETDADGIEQASGLSLDQCVCEKGLYDPIVNQTGSPCVTCPAGANCLGDTNRPTSKLLYYGSPAPYTDFFLRCHRMMNYSSPCLGGDKCLDGFEQQSCSRCSSGYYRFQRQCVKCVDSDHEMSLIAAYFFLLIAFYVVKKLSTIVLPSMYIILTYIQCLSIVGNRQGWGTIRTKYFLKSTEIVNFPLDLFIPSCADEMPFVHKAVFFTVTPISYVLVDVVLVDIVFRWCWPKIADALAFVIVKFIRVKYALGAKRGEQLSDFNAKSGQLGQLRHELGLHEQSTRGGWYLQSPVEAEEALDSKFGDKKNPVKKAALRWAGRRMSKRFQRKASNDGSSTESTPRAQPTRSPSQKEEGPPLTFLQKCTKHFFEDMRLMYVATTAALLKTLRCTPVGDRNIAEFWLSGPWFGNSVLSADPAQKCWEGEHAKLVPYFVIMLILYGLGYPLATLLVLNNAKNPEKRQGWHPKVYGRLYRRFEPQYYWWEVVYLIRRLCLVSFRTLMNDRRAEVYLARTMQGWQALSFLVTLCAALLAQFYAHPFKLEHMDLLDAVLLCCLFMVVWVSMAFDYALKGTQEVEVLEGLLFLIIAVSVLVSAYALLLDTYHSYVKSKKPVPRWILIIVFTFTPPPVLVGLGLASKSTAAQIKEMGEELEKAKDTADGTASVRKVIEMQRKMSRLHKRQKAEDSDLRKAEEVPNKT